MSRNSSDGEQGSVCRFGVSRCLNLIVGLVVLISLVGCAPFPHYVTIAPKTVGKVTKAGAPAVGAKVYFDWGRSEPCPTNSAESSIVDQGGYFNLDRVTQFRLLYAPLVAPVSVAEYRVCISTPEGNIVGFSGISSLYQDRSSVLFCNLDHPQLDKLIHRVGPPVYCEILR